MSKDLEDFGEYMIAHALALESAILLLVFDSILDRLLSSNLELLNHLAINLYSRSPLFVYLHRSRSKIKNSFEENLHKSFDV